MRSLLFLIALLTCGAVCRAQTFTYNQGGAAPNYYEVLPYEIVKGKLFVTVELAGVKHRFLFDTGAPDMISNALADELKAPEIYTDSIMDVNGETSVATVVKADIPIGSTVFAGVPAIKGLPGTLLGCMKIDGILGSNLLRNSIVSIDGRKQLIIITDQKDRLILNKKNSTKLTSDNIESTPIVQLLIGGKVDLLIEFDTGDNDFFRLTDDITGQMKRYNVFDVLETGYGANTLGEMGLQKDAPKTRIKIPFLNIAHARFNNVITETSKEGIPGFGSRLLNYGNVTMDFIHHKFYFDPDSTINDLAEKQWPLEPAVNGDKLIVGVVWDKFANQAKPGEQIIAIDNTDFSKIDICDYITHPPVLAGKDTAILTIKDKDGNLRKLRMVKE